MQATTMFRLPCVRRKLESDCSVPRMELQQLGAIYLQDNATTSKTVKCQEGDLVQNIIKKVCQELEIEPMARFFFALCDRKSQVPLSPFSHLSKQDSKNQFQLRIFVNVSNCLCLWNISTTAYNYYYQQLCHDFLNDHDNMQPHVSLNSAVWMAAIYMAKEAKDSGSSFEELMNEAERYLPKFLYRSYQRDNKVRRKLKEVFDRFFKLNVTGSHYIYKFLEVYEKDAVCGRHAFPLKQSKKMSLLSMESQYVMVSWREGIQMVTAVGNTKNYPELISSIENVSALMADFVSCQLAVSKMDETEVHLCFGDVKDLIGFSVTVQTYHWLKVDCNSDIFRGDIAPSDRSSYSRCNDRTLCHGPINEHAVEQALLQHFSEGNFLLRESGTKDNAYTLYICHDHQALRYRIIRNEDETYSFKDSVKLEGDQEWQTRIHRKFASLCDLIKNHRHNTDGLVTLLSTNLSPEVVGHVPLLPSKHHSDASRSSTSSAFSDISVLSSGSAANVPVSGSLPQSNNYILWTKPHTNMQCRGCRQKCSRAEFVHLCSDNCDHFYCTNCASEVPKGEQLTCYHCHPITLLQVSPPKESARAQGGIGQSVKVKAKLQVEEELAECDNGPKQKCVDLSTEEKTVKALPCGSTCTST